MLLFMVRRILVSIPILLASFFVVFGLVTISGDPLAFLRESNNPNKDQQIAQLSNTLGLDRPFVERFWDWLTGIVTLDFGVNKRGQNVWPILTDAVQTTFRLVLLATVISILIGIVVGILSAIRQYSTFDYSSTFAAFLFFALPVFWLAVLLKQFGAIEFNDWLERPSVGLTGLILVAAMTGLFWSAVVGGSRQRRVLVGVGAAAASVAFLLDHRVQRLDTEPGPVPGRPGPRRGGHRTRRHLGLRRDRQPPCPRAGPRLGGRLAGPRLHLRQLAGRPELDPARRDVRAVARPRRRRRPRLRRHRPARRRVGRPAVGGPRRVRRPHGRLHVGVDTGSRTVATVGPQTPNLSGTFWERMIDYAGHQVLPTLALALIGFATFSRFTRASMLETMNSDYVRTAKAKGLRPAQVILRHGFRTALIPVVTVISLSFASVIEGATITETVFGWEGMGQLFISSLRDVDPYPVMGFMVVVSVTIVVVNAIADLLYAYLDPRIRLD